MAKGRRLVAPSGPWGPVPSLRAAGARYRPLGPGTVHTAAGARYRPHGRWGPVPSPGARYRPRGASHRLLWEASGSLLNIKEDP